MSEAPHGKTRDRIFQKHVLGNSSNVIAEKIAGAAGPPIVIQRPPTLSNAFESAEGLLRVQSSNDSFSSSQESIELEEIPRSLANSTGENKFSRTVKCSLHVTFDGSTSRNDLTNFDYKEHDFYRTIEKIAEEHVKRAHAGAGALIAKQLNFKYGNCTIVSEEKERHGIPLTTQADWNDVCKILDRCGKASSHHALHLHVFRDYFPYRSRASSEASFAGTKRMEIQSLMKRASDGMRGRLYIPRPALMRFTSRDNIREIIIQDARLNMTMTLEEKEEFILDVQTKSRYLLAMCVHARLKMDCLKVLLGKGLTDESLPLTDDHCCHAKCTLEFDALLDKQGGFATTARFDNVGEHQDFHPSVVIPIHYQPVDMDEEEFVIQGRAKDWDKRGTAGSKDSPKWKAYCGHGAYSNVYRVRVDPDHHRLSKNKDMDFALKEFNDRPQRGDTDFRQELRTLNELRNYPHKHIVTHVATWTQDSKYYMLFPYAQCNLREYMSWKQFGNPSKQNILWLLKQLLGLAEALKDIHNLSNVPQLSSAPGLTAHPQPELRKSGWHHDLKAENILLYRSPGPSRGTFQISDFGSGKIHTYRSGSVNTRSPNGTLTYEPPESKAKGATSRPYDMWSLGCVFFEILIWAEMGFASLYKFHEKRVGLRFPGAVGNILEDDAYWQMAPDGEVTKREAVDTWLEDLRARISQQGPQPFQEVLDLVVRMLEIEPRRRILALDLWDTLSRIYTQTKIDLKDVTDESMPRCESPESPSSSLVRMSLGPPDRQSPEFTGDRPSSLIGDKTTISGGTKRSLTNPPTEITSAQTHRNQRRQQSSGPGQSSRPRHPLELAQWSEEHR